MNRGSSSTLANATAHGRSVQSCSASLGRHLGGSPRSRGCPSPRLGTQLLPALGRRRATAHLGFGGQPVATLSSRAARDSRSAKAAARTSPCLVQACVRFHPLDALSPGLGRPVRISAAMLAVKSISL
ncbi:hypothetical protein NDU88_004112 [Pleurodeles waltl]|uniref:Uncharacterized protein n=1 Tax=Pleurodeles waltl TaxID=8319 RepID=A0AAV7MWJ7_PLEWA|nr:hypothetical protein NDU88_004112 [Pleurodeles waltl]